MRPAPPFRALERSIRIVCLLRSLLALIRSRDPKLHNQIRDADSSTALNLGEGNKRQGRDRLHLFRIASGSNEDVRTALRVAIAWGYLREDRTTEVLEQIDVLQAILWRLL